MSPATPVTSFRSGQRVAELIGRGCDSALDAFVILLAAWVVAYHMALVTAWPLALVTAQAIITGLGALVWYSRSVPDRHHGSSSPSAPVVLVLAVIYGILALLIRRQDADDVAYVSWATWVEERNFIPTKDVILSDHVLAGVPTPFAFAWETLVGVIARVAGIDAGTIMYVVAPPVLAVLAVLSMSRLIRAAEFRWPTIVLLGAMTYLLWGGELHTSFGNMGIVRVWQAKAIYLSILIPFTYAALLLWMRDGDRRQLSLGIAAGVVGVGLTGTAFMVLPLVVIAISIVALIAGPRSRMLGLFLVGIYPAVIYVGNALSVVENFAAGADLTQVTVFRFTGIVEKVLGHGLLLVLVVAALGAGWILSPLRFVKGALISSFLVVAAAMSSAAQAWLHDVTGLGAVLWRVVWAMPLPMLVGGLVAAVAAESARLLPGIGKVAVIAPTSFMLALIVWTGTPLWSPANQGATISAPGWKLDPAALETARDIERVAREMERGKLIAVPTSVSIALSSVTSWVHPATTRDEYHAHAEPRFQLAERLVAREVAEGRAAAVDPAAFRAAAQELGIDLACVVPASGEFMRRVGWRRLASSRLCDIYRRQ